MYGSSRWPDGPPAPDGNPHHGHCADARGLGFGLDNLDQYQHLIGPAQAASRHTGAGKKRGLKTRACSHLGRESVPDGGHCDKVRFC